MTKSKAEKQSEFTTATFRMESSDLARIAKIARRQDQSRSAIVREALRVYFESRDK